MAWTMTGQDDEETPRLTALGVTGQIVSVEILKLLDSETLITSLSRLAIVAPCPGLTWRVSIRRDPRVSALAGRSSAIRCPQLSARVPV